MAVSRAAQPKRWIPTIGQEITVHLPFEMVRGIVEKHVNADTIAARLSVQPPMGNGHSYRFKQLVVLHRQPGQPAGDIWVAEDK